MGLFLGGVRRTWLRGDEELVRLGVGSEVAIVHLARDLVRLARLDRKQRWKMGNKRFAPDPTANGWY